MVKVEKEQFVPAMRDIAEMFTDPNRLVAQEAALQRQMRGTERDRVRATTNYARSLGRDVLDKTVPPIPQKKKVAPKA